MKNIVYIVLLVSQIFFAQNNFDKGNSLYKNGKYEQAIDAYTSELTAKKHSAELYFNLGNCYYKLNKVAPAIYNYEKALVLKPNDSEIANNLKFAQKRTVDEIKEVPKVGFAKLLRDFTALYHYNSWAWISVAFSVLFLVSFLGYYFSALTLHKRLFFAGMFVMFLLLLLSVASAIFEKSHFKNERPAIVFAEMTDVKSEPQNKGASVVILHEGTKVFVKETVDNWKKIQLTDGSEGWIDSNAIKEVK
ncbi:MULTISPECIES: tetratricopeptide repeat protein [Flavobacterium]|uniref:BatE protein n=1 Tax=Flavobacterium commune TaxID=1306519 RepID=A0A1D9P8S5_9FLAO|nr:MULTISPECIES: tetratricopeptide repeat protein [Flavobacterium]AOZ98970.1 BatE protein [Flavobacterium commune]